MVVRTRNAPAGPSPFLDPSARTLAAGKFVDPETTATGEPRARVPFGRLELLWFNTGTLCNLQCANCYIESSPTNDALVYLSAQDVVRYLDEISARSLGTSEIGFTGGEPFMNPGIIKMLAAALAREHEVLVLTNAMRPMQRYYDALLALRERFGSKLTIRVSLDHYTRRIHEAERGPESWQPALDGLCWLSANRFSIAVAGRHLKDEAEEDARLGYSRLFATHNIVIDALDRTRLVLFPEMDAAADIPEITTACWNIVGKSPNDIMCASSRMVVHRKNEPLPRVAACTLIPHDPNFDMGATLEEAQSAIPLNHPHCARFCVLGGASCSA